MIAAVVAGSLAGAVLGFVLARADLCFHSMFAGAFEGRTRLLRGWLLGVAVAAVGLTVLYASPWSAGLNTGLAFRPVSNVLGGLLIGVGMVVARSCVSGLFYKLGAGMLGAVVGIGAWGAGELAASLLPSLGPTLLPGGTAGTIPAVLGLPRLGVALVLLVVTVVGTSLVRRGRDGAADRAGAVWAWPVVGVTLGATTIAGWLLAAAGGSSYGPSTVGAVRGLVVGGVSWWLVAFLPGIVLGAHLAARTSRTWRPRGETRVRYLQLAGGGFLLGAGGWIAGGCNLGHGLSGAAQLNVSSWVVVAAMATGVAVAGRGRTWSRRGSSGQASVSTPGA